MDSRFCALCAAATSSEHRRENVKLRASRHGVTTDAEREALEAVYAYEEVLREVRGKNVRAARTWQMIKRHGVIEAIERIVARPMETQGYRALADMGLEEMAFEAVVLRHPSSFTEQAVMASRERLARLKQS